ncbi:hypothetical protein [Yoonia sp. I 8.24]|uniref:COG3904 family protein n=1 Tax=Yoonia sp. I 8.24 TaxID=1537229 RepID=UPI001EE10FDD|nr:hypothetical protein [Yoonia sp. I 8.24]MCG3267049.1 hypothetical protein [Yoonia sp. I 8.24]
MKLFRVFVVICLGASGPVMAQKLPVSDDAPIGKFFVDGTTLVYNTNNVPPDQYAEMDSTDVEGFSDILAEHPNTKLLRLTSTGGSVWAGEQMARIAMDYRLDTRVSGECSSACVTLFLAGESREMDRGSAIGFHQNAWNADGLREYYKYWHLDENWDNPFDFGQWLYRDVQTEMHNQLSYLVARGVDPVFAIETKRERSNMWYPTRRQLEEAGVLRD